ncbi:hypothetical protein GQ54DRAFT_305184 [Martensiomyces pterosporus]|nr:hypothetical protein GQ54DRAFT_305184 [Martensiomyces pterosporus]
MEPTEYTTADSARYSLDSPTEGYKGGDSPTFSTAEYFNAFTDIDRSIRNLIDGSSGSVQSSISPRGSATSAPLRPLTANNKSRIEPSSPPESPSTTGSSAVAFQKPAFPESSYMPPGLDSIEDDGEDDEAAAVAFLCSGLPHYEGNPPIQYDNLDESLAEFCDKREDAASFGDTLENEEIVSEDAWEPSAHKATQQQQLWSPQTLNGSPKEAAGLANYEGWIDFDELANIARRVLPIDNTECRIGRRTETDYMLLYAIDAGGSANDMDKRWHVQIPKPSVPPEVFESEVLSLAYVQQNTDLPVSTVWTYEFTASNSVGVPYAILSSMPGESLSVHWGVLDSREKRKILDQIADAVVQLSELEFPLIGSLVMSDDGATIGPLLDPRQGEAGYSDLDPAVHSVSDSDADCSPDGLPEHRASKDALDILDCEGQSGDDDYAEPSLDRIELEMYEQFVDRFVIDKYDKGPFVLMPQSFDHHHFLIDRATGRLTGLVDWTYSSIRPLPSLIQPPSFAFDDTPRWEPTRLEARMAYRRNLVRYRQWFKAGLQKRAWAVLGKQKSEEFAELVCLGYWRYKFEYEAMENVQYNNPWTFRAIWEHLNPGQEFAIWFATSRSRVP